jgi:hypothetical protein
MAHRMSSGGLPTLLQADSHRAGDDTNMRCHGETTATATHSNATLLSSTETRRRRLIILGMVPHLTCMHMCMHMCRLG